ncbi:hypothetical protein BB559_001637 [Furculomyces boomerangus]|uniref:Uncharacterized protein n=2 Tax=Harpellales TaxID=61421 RepID=A0A2T9Z1A8_9FUNG|nr:hypothetical protein BB559_001637 [Furculomyces boomerangus]
MKDMFKNYDGDIRLNILSESGLHNFVIQQLHQNILLYMYQSNLVRDSNIMINSERVREAKLDSLSTAETLARNLVWANNNIPSKYFTLSMVSNTVVGAALLTNTVHLKYDDRIEYFYKTFQTIKEIYKEIGKKSEVMNSIITFIDYITKISDTAHKKNVDYTDLVLKMRPYSISNYDLHPWVVPKFASLFFFSCCFKENFSTLDIAEYLSPLLNKSSSSTPEGNIKTLKDKEIFPNDNENHQKAGSNNISDPKNKNSDIDPNEFNFGSFEYMFISNTKKLRHNFGVSNKINPGLGRSNASLSIIINKYDINPYYYIRKTKEIKDKEKKSDVSPTEIEKEIVKNLKRKK